MTQLLQKRKLKNRKSWLNSLTPKLNIHVDWKGSGTHTASKHTVEVEPPTSHHFFFKGLFIDDRSRKETDIVQEEQIVVF